MTVAQPVAILLVEDNPDDVSLALHPRRTARITNSIQTIDAGVGALDFLFGEGHFIDRFPADLPKAILPAHPIA